MPPRAYWKGHIRLSLVSFPVQLIPAIDSKERVSFHRIHRPTGERVRYQPIVPDRGPVDSDEIAKGYEYEKGRYAILDDEEIEKLKLESTHTLDIVQFVDLHEIDPIYHEKPYFVLPDGAFAEEAYRVVRDAMREMRKVAVGQIVLSTRERIAAIRPCTRGMLLETLRYDDEVREASRYFADIGEGSAGGDQLELAKQLIKMKSAPFDPEKFKDHYQAALRQLVAAKLQGRQPVGVPEDTGAPKVINLMEALKRSLKNDPARQAEASDGASAPATKKPRAGAKKPTGGETPPRRKKSA
jgi:DNA end-binding protein Ku